MLMEKFEPKCDRHNKILKLIPVDGKRNSNVYICTECEKTRGNHGK